MDISDWRIIDLLAKEHTISKVAELMFLTQPALSYRLKKIEQELGTQLFFRTHTGILFTPIGEKLSSFASDYLRLNNQVQEELLRSGNKDSGQISIGVTGSFANHRLPSLISDFCHLYPKVDISITANKSSIIYRELQNGYFNIAIVRGDLVWSEMKILLQEEPIYIVSSSPIEEKNLPNMPFIAAPQSGIYLETLNWWNEHFHAIPAKLLMSVNDMETALQMVSHGIGWTFLPKIFVENHSDLCCKSIYRTNGEQITRRTYILCRSAISKMPLIENFIQFVLSRVQN